MKIDYLVEKYSRLIYKICFDMLMSPQDAEDATQDTFLNYYRVEERYNELSENEIKNILCKIALNRCRDILKSKIKKYEKVIDEDLNFFENHEDGFDIDYDIIKSEESTYVRKLVDELKEPYSTIVNYYYIDGFSLDNISIKTGIPKTTLKMQLYRAKKQLKEKIISDKGGGLLERE